MYKTDHHNKGNKHHILKQVSPVHTQIRPLYDKRERSVSSRCPSNCQKLFVFIFSHGCIIWTSLNFHSDYFDQLPLVSFFLFFKTGSFDILQTGLELIIITQAGHELTRSCHSLLSINITDMRLQFLPHPPIIRLFLSIVWHMFNLSFVLLCSLAVYFYRPHFWSRMRDFHSKTHVGNRETPLFKMKAFFSLERFVFCMPEWGRRSPPPFFGVCSPGWLIIPPLLLGYKRTNREKQSVKELSGRLLRI